MIGRVLGAFFWSVMFAASVGVSACETSSSIEVESPCFDTTCVNGSECDPADGICKCGGSGDLVCADSEVCISIPSYTCITSLCDFVVCHSGMSCDASTGVCSCGQSFCAENERCEAGHCESLEPCHSIICEGDSVCDPEFAECRCGEKTCSEGEICNGGECVFDACFGIHCGLNQICSQSDGVCRCGGSDGEICSTGEACLDVEGEPRCAIGTKCELAGCAHGTSCDPDDGSCRCGGVGPSHPICSPEQSCIDGACKGGVLCESGGVRTVCSNGMACDPTDGQCKCGGALCGEDEVCANLGVQPTCMQRCTLLENPTTCAQGEGCYFDPQGADGQGVCASRGNRGLDGECRIQNHCMEGLFCHVEMERCAQICGVAVGSEFCAAVSPELRCAPFGEGSDMGFCF